MLFGEWLLIGTQEFVYGIRLDSLIKIEFPVNGYFKQFLIQENRVYVFDANGIFALDENLHILWQNRDLAVDGVLFKKMADADTMLVSCEMDPPGGWISRCLNIRNGEELLCSP